MEKVYVRVTEGPFAGFTGELIDGDITVVIYGSPYHIGCPAYVVLDATVPAPATYDFNRNFCWVKK